MAICLFISKLGRYCGAVFDMRKPLLPIGRNTPSSSLRRSPMPSPLINASGFAVPDLSDFLDAEPALRTHEIHRRTVHRRLRAIDRLGTQQREETARAGIDISGDDAAIARDAADH